MVWALPCTVVAPVMSTAMQKPDSDPQAPPAPPSLSPAPPLGALGALGADPPVIAEHPVTAARTAVTVATSNRLVRETMTALPRGGDQPAVDRRWTATADDHGEIGGL
jgi:hypothetical protein